MTIRTKDAGQRSHHASLTADLGVVGHAHSADPVVGHGRHLPSTAGSMPETQGAGSQERAKVMLKHAQHTYQTIHYLRVETNSTAPHWNGATKMQA